MGVNSNEFILITIWKDAAAKEHDALSDWDRAIIPAEAWPLLEDWKVLDYKSFGIFDRPLGPLFQNL